MTQDNQNNNPSTPNYPEMEDYGNTDGNWDREDVVADQLPGEQKPAAKASDDWDREDVVADGLQGNQTQSDKWDREDVVADGLQGGTDFDSQGQGVGDQQLDSGSAAAGQFGEFGNTGTGVDLTLEMDSDKADPRTGMVKGGQPGEDSLAGLAQYGGEAGDIPPQGRGNIDGNE